MKKLLSILILCIFVCNTAFAVPSDLWQKDERVEKLFGTGLDEKQEIDILQKLLDYIGVIDKDNLSHSANTTKEMFLTSFGKIIGIDSDNPAEIEAAMRKGYIRKEDNLSKITFDTVLFAALRVTGYCEEYFSVVDCYSMAKREDFLYNLVYEGKRAVTQREFVQLLYNTLSVNVLTPKYYAKDRGTFLRDENAPLLQAVWGITLKRDIVTAVYGESIYPFNTCEWGEIFINDVFYKYNPKESVEGLVGRECAYFIEDDNLVLFAEADEYNKITELLPYGDFSFKANMVEYTAEGKNKKLSLSDNVKVVYNGVFAGQYCVDIAARYISDDSHITLIDNNTEKGVDVMLIRRYFSYPVQEWGAEGVISFKYNMTYQGKNYIDVLPEDNHTKVDLFMDGVRVDFADAKIGGVISIANSVNEKGITYTRIELGCESISSLLEGTVDNDTYVLEGKDYPVSKLLLEAQKAYGEITIPSPGKEYTFTLDVNGTVADVNYVNDTLWGYLVRIGTEKGLDKTGKVKIFTAEGEMVTYTICDEPVLHDKNSHDGRVCTVEQFASNVMGLKEDYRNVVKFKANKKGELTELWLPVTNNNLETDGPGTVDYEVTRDYVYSGTAGMYYYNGIVQYLYSFPQSAPCFCVPTSFNADDSLYQVKQASAWGNTNTPILELYSLDEFGVVGAGLMYDDGNDYTLNTNLVVIEKIGYGIGVDGDTKPMIYGWQNGSKVKLSVNDEKMLSHVFGDYEALTINSLEFGDIIQVNMLNGEVSGFRVIYKVNSPPENGGIWRYNGAERTTLEGHSRFEAAVGTLKAKKGLSFVAEFEAAGVVKPVCFYGISSMACYVVDMENHTLNKVASPEMNMYTGTQIVIQKNWSQVNNVYLYK